MPDDIPEARPDWLAFYIFYTAASRPLIVECVTPLIAKLKAHAVITQYFFMNYWLEGPHLRLRIKLASETVAAEVEVMVLETLRRFLVERPAVYSIKPEMYAEMFDQLFDLEFAAEERSGHLDENGQMRLQPNNSVTLAAYEPEYGKYGGARGIEIAEWHFEKSSDVVARIVAMFNVHSRPILLGMSAQLSLILAAVFLGDSARIASYMYHYHLLWKNALGGSVMFSGPQYEKARSTVDLSQMQRRYELICNALDSPDQTLPSPFNEWMAHCIELKARIAVAAPKGDLVFASWEGGEDDVIVDPTAALERLMSAYMHMTNNRLQVTLGDEAYLALIISGMFDDAELKA